jgi:hypothetical protein
MKLESGWKLVLRIYDNNEDELGTWTCYDEEIAKKECINIGTKGFYIAGMYYPPHRIGKITVIQQAVTE